MPSEERKYYHPDPHHDSNWCAVCGLYYCWHTEAITSDELREKYGHYEQKHPFVPCKTCPMCDGKGYVKESQYKNCCKELEEAEKEIERLKTKPKLELLKKEDGYWLYATSENIFGIYRLATEIKSIPLLDKFVLEDEE